MSENHTCTQVTNVHLPLKTFREKEATKIKLASTRKGKLFTLQHSEAQNSMVASPVHQDIHS